VTSPDRARFVGGVLDGEEIVFQADAWPESVSFRGDTYDLRQEGDNLLYIYAETPAKEDQA
jgi:hypothetical protein